MISILMDVPFNVFHQIMPTLRVTIMSPIFSDCIFPSKVEPELLRRRVDQGNVFTHRQHFGGPLLNGRIPGAEAVQMRTNDYLSIARDTRIAEAEIKVLQS